MKRQLLIFIILWTTLIAWCSLQKNIDNHDVDMSDFTLCTELEKNANVCNLVLDPVCWDNNKTYDNSCLACASHEISGYFVWECYASCDNPDGICTLENLTEDTD